jgi:hypothetical protein
VNGPSCPETETATRTVAVTLDEDGARVLEAWMRPAHEWEPLDERAGEKHERCRRCGVWRHTHADLVFYRWRLVSFMDEPDCVAPRG